MVASANIVVGIAGKEIAERIACLAQYFERGGCDRWFASRDSHCHPSFSPLKFRQSLKRERRVMPNPSLTLQALTCMPDYPHSQNPCKIRNSSCEDSPTFLISRG